MLFCHSVTIAMFKKCDYGSWRSCGVVHDHNRISSPKTAHCHQLGTLTCLAQHKTLSTFLIIIISVCTSTPHLHSHPRPQMEQNNLLTVSGKWQRPLMAQWLRRASQGHEMHYPWSGGHGVWIAGWVKLGCVLCRAAASYLNKKCNSC